MKKVYYSVTRYGKKNVDSMSGVGYITDEDLIIACSSKEQKPYIRVFEDCLKDCYPIAGKTNEFKGKYYEIREVELTHLSICCKRLLASKQSKLYFSLLKDPNY